MGDVVVRRAYYYCRHCRTGDYPWDQTLGLGTRQLTPTVEEMVALAGVSTSFAVAQLILDKVGGLTVAFIVFGLPEVGGWAGMRAMDAAARGVATARSGRRGDAERGSNGDMASGDGEIPRADTATSDADGAGGKPRRREPPPNLLASPNFRFIFGSCGSPTSNSTAIRASPSWTEPRIPRNS